MKNDDDYDLGEFWRDVNKARQEKRADNRQSSAEMLTAAGISFVEKNFGAHLIVTHNGMTVDFWPGTGRWKTRAGKTGFGVRNLMAALGRGGEP